ncbi:hypothetical protein CY34DRAFT_501696 [Suillus luteus UH-Slu-Lm8-n1]|uniref:Uncharacterized protein n=1 Tax=Suillus luteus UH-Slu-Lm8-n1 TaxID=930992 RepID=A0A0D0BRK4_9AGAM|nr:hypothetical protein CY34DRAFT_501696 [Suillus luteus UH-Slu-Lm8-n1]
MGSHAKLGEITASDPSHWHTLHASSTPQRLHQNVSLLKRPSTPGSHPVKLQFVISWFSITRGDEKPFAVKRSRASPDRSGNITYSCQSGALPIKNKQMNITCHALCSSFVAVLYAARRSGQGEPLEHTIPNKHVLFHASTGEYDYLTAPHCTDETHETRTPCININDHEQHLK